MVYIVFQESLVYAFTFSTRRIKAKKKKQKWQGIENGIPQDQVYAKFWPFPDFDSEILISKFDTYFFFLFLLAFVFTINWFRLIAIYEGNSIKVEPHGRLNPTIFSQTSIRIGETSFFFEQLSLVQNGWACNNK